MNSFRYDQLLDALNVTFLFLLFILTNLLTALLRVYYRKPSMILQKKLNLFF
jgi:hypothetical protein